LSGGAIFVGEKGRIEIVRNDCRTDPPKMIKELPPTKKCSNGIRAVAGKVSHAGVARLHADAKSSVGGCRDRAPFVSICHLAIITRELNRRLKWNPEAERFIGDEEGNALLSRPRRKGYELPPVS